ncbi:MAG: hypothetical protein ACRYFW_10800 [Janthinobacterium lividum]
MFDDVMWASSEMTDIAVEHPDCPSHPEGFVSRVVVHDPSDRLLRTAAMSYLNVGTVLQIVDGGRRLVLGPAACVDDAGADAAAAASEVYADIMRIVFGGDDGEFVVRTMSRSQAAAGLGAKRAERSALDFPLGSLLLPSEAGLNCHGALRFRSTVVGE